MYSNVFDGDQNINIINRSNYFIDLDSVQTIIIQTLHDLYYFFLIQPQNLFNLLSFLLIQCL